MRSSRVPEDMKGHALQAGLLDRVLELPFQVVERLVRRLSGKDILRSNRRGMARRVSMAV